MKGKLIIFGAIAFLGLLLLGSAVHYTDYMAECKAEGYSHFECRTLYKMGR